MSAKKKQRASAPGKRQRRPSASPADGKQQERALRAEDWDFSEILSAYRKGGRNLDAPEGRQLIAAALYEYARESDWFRRVCRELPILESKLAEKYGPGWDAPDVEGWQEKPLGAPSPIPPSVFDPLHTEWEKLVKRFADLEQRMGAGHILRAMHSELAADTPWLCIQPARRTEVIEDAWSAEPRPRWIGMPEVELPDDRAVRKGEPPEWLARSGPAFPRELLNIAAQDAEEERRWGKREQRGDVTQGEASERTNQQVQALYSGTGTRRTNAMGEEVVAFRLNWSLTNEEMLESFGKMLEVWRPKAFAEFASNRRAAVAPENALIELAAYRFNPSKEKHPDAARGRFWKLLLDTRVKDCSSEPKFSQFRGKARTKLGCLGLIESMVSDFTKSNA